ncbi:hypothetical protein MRX96_048500 [Rhipicephalus microplus]
MSVGDYYIPKAGRKATRYPPGLSADALTPNKLPNSPTSIREASLHSPAIPTLAHSTRLVGFELKHSVRPAEAARTTTKLAGSLGHVLRVYKRDKPQEKIKNTFAGAFTSEKCYQSTVSVAAALLRTFVTVGGNRSVLVFREEGRR